MWVTINNTGVQIKENEISRIWCEEEKRRGKGKRKWVIYTEDELTNYRKAVYTFDEHEQAQVALIKIVNALDERRSRLEL